MQKTKVELLELLENEREYFEKMQKGLGHHSWWYTNRGSEDCINVKLHAWVDRDLVLEGLSDKHKKIIECLNVDIDSLINSEYEMIIESERDFYQDILKNDFDYIKDFEYGGRSGGWLCVVYDFGYLCNATGLTIDDDFNNETIASIKSMLDVCNKKRVLIGDVNEKVKQYIKDLENTLSNTKQYSDIIGDYLDNLLDTELEKFEQLTKI